MAQADERHELHERQRAELQRDQCPAQGDQHLSRYPVTEVADVMATEITAVFTCDNCKGQSVTDGAKPSGWSAELPSLSPYSSIAVSYSDGSYFGGYPAYCSDCLTAAREGMMAALNARKAQ